MIPFPIARPQGCDIQIFYGGDASGNAETPTSPWKAWNKPRGVSHIYIMLIGGGSDGISTASGGSGAVTVWYGAAQHIPDMLFVLASAAAGTAGGPDTVIRCINTSSGNPILSANKTQGANGGTAMVANNFTASGFFQSTAGQDGVTVGAPSASPTTFLSAGGFGSSPSANYGYTANNSSPGFFMMQPIIVGRGTAAGNVNVEAAYGCGGAPNTKGGPGLALIASW